MVVGLVMIVLPIDSTVPLQKFLSVVTYKKALEMPTCVLIYKVHSTILQCQIQ